MQESILAADPELDLKVYALWMPILGRDTRESCDAGLIPDPRVTRYWDAERLSGSFFKSQPDFASFSDPVVWDAYALYGPTRYWSESPAPALGSGWTIIAQSETLRELMTQLPGLPQLGAPVFLPSLLRSQ